MNTSTMISCSTSIIIVKFDEMDSNSKGDDEVIFIQRGESSINIAEHLYDYILINIPMQVFHPNDSEGRSTCNPTILKKLIQNQEKQDESVDPRWAKLSNLK